MNITDLLGTVLSGNATHLGFSLVSMAERVSGQVGVHPRALITEALEQGKAKLEGAVTSDVDGFVAYIETTYLK